MNREIRNNRKEYKTWKKGYYHLCTDGWKNGLLFNSVEQFIIGTILLGIITIRFGVKVYCYALMPNHIHIILSGTGEVCVKVFDYLSEKINSKLKKDGYPQLPEDYSFKLIPIEDEEQMRNNCIYVIRNAFEKGLSVPGGYPWSSGWFYFSEIGRMIRGTKVKDINKTKIYEMTGRNTVLPEEWEIHPEFGLLPRFIISEKLIIKLFRTAKEYESSLVKDYEGFINVARDLDEAPDLSEQERKSIAKTLASQMFRGKPLRELSNEERAKLSPCLHFDYSFTPEQIADVLRMEERIVKQILNSKDYGRRNR